MIVGQDEIVDGVLTCLLAGGQALLEGVPGLGKTMLVRTLANALQLDFARIQFTPDLMPADILGTNGASTEERRGREAPVPRVPEGPGVRQHRSGRRDQPRDAQDAVALLEAMQEKSASRSATRTYKLDPPFFVLAHAEPARDGGYLSPARGAARPLPLQAPGQVPLEPRRAAHDHRPHHREVRVPRRSTPVLDAQRRILEMRKGLVRDVPCRRHVKDYAIKPRARPRTPTAPHAHRDGQPLRMALRLEPARRPGDHPDRQDARAHGRALQRLAVDDVRRIAVKQALRHRVILNFEGEAEGVATDTVLEDILGSIRETT